MNIPILIEERRGERILTNVVLPGGWGVDVCWKIYSSDSRNMKRETRKTRIQNVGQANQVIIVLKLIEK